MTTKYNVGDDVLIDGVVDSIYIETKENEPVYNVRIKGAGVQEVYRIRLNDSVMSASVMSAIQTCATCMHRDPEDKKCDCGAMERQGCQFPVSDDYFCKFYDKGGAE